MEQDREGRHEECISEPVARVGNWNRILLGAVGDSKEYASDLTQLTKRVTPKGINSGISDPCTSLNLQPGKKNSTGIELQMFTASSLGWVEVNVKAMWAEHQHCMLGDRLFVVPNF